MSYRIAKRLIPTNMETLQASNNLKFTATKKVGNKEITVKIRLNDECKNGHQDFAITGDIYEADRPKIDKYYISGGCIHDDILKHFPEFKMFVRLHLSDFNGTPMYPVANGYYHLTDGFNSVKNDSPEFEAEFCEYYRITPKQFKHLQKARTKIEYGVILEHLNIPAQWKKEADEAIKELEKLTGLEFVNDSTRTQWDGATPEEVEEFNKQLQSGYYTPKQIAQRNKAEGLQILNKEIASIEKEIAGKNLEIQAKKAVFKAGGAKALNNIIYYNHTNTITFNWRGYENMPEQEVNNIIARLKLPKGVKAEISKK